MTRSRRKHPIIGFTMAESDKWWKQLSSRRLRRKVRRAIRRGWYDMAKWLCGKEVTSLWDSPKDGKHPFDPEKHPECMRKWQVSNKNLTVCDTCKKKVAIGTPFRATIEMEKSEFKWEYLDFCSFECLDKWVNKFRICTEYSIDAWEHWLSDMAERERGMQQCSERFWVALR